MEATVSYYNFINNLQFKLKALKRLKHLRKLFENKKTERNFSYSDKVYC